MKGDKSASQDYGIILAMRGRPKMARTEAERHDFKLESSKRAHASGRRETWYKKHATPARTSAKPPPTIDELRTAYQRRNESCEAMIRLGSMLEDIEAAHGVGYKFEKYDDSGAPDSYFIDYDAPWQTGIRGFLKEAPDLLAAYKTLMRYKKLSADFREAIELYDPNPASLVFDGPDEPWLVPVRERARKLLAGCGRSFRMLLAKIVEYGQQSGLRPEPPPRAQGALAVARRGKGDTEGVRGMHPPHDVTRGPGA